MSKRQASTTGISPSRRTWGIVLILGAVALVVALSRRGDQVDLGGLYRRDDIKVGDAPQAVAATDGGVWITNGGDASVSFVDPETGRVADPIGVSEIPSGIAADDRFVYVGFGEGQTSVVRIDADTREVVDPPIRVGRSPSSISASEEGVFVAAIVGDVVARLEPTTGSVTTRAGNETFDFPAAVASGAGSVWVADVVRDEVVRLDPGSLEVIETIETGVSPTAITFGEGAVWVASFEGSLTRIDPRDNSTDRIQLDAEPAGVTTGEGFVWVTLPTEDAVVRFDARTNEPAGAPIGVGRQPQGLDYEDGVVWIAAQRDDAVTRLDLHPDD